MADLPPKLQSKYLYGRVSSLLDASIHAIINNLSCCIEGVGNLPGNLKNRCLYLMSKRGLITDSNIEKVLHSDLKVLDLSECDISDESLCHFRKCPKLVKLDLNAAKQSRSTITSQGVVEVAKTCPHLQTIYLRRCINLTDEALITLSTNCPQIRYINIGGCNLITDQSLIAIGQKLHFLRSINFSRTKVTDNGVLSLVAGACAKSLKEVHMDGCVELTDEAVEGVLQFCPQINILLFHGCPKITEMARQALEQLTIERAAPMKQVTWTIY